MKNILPARHPFRKLKSIHQIWPFDPDWDAEGFDAAGRTHPCYEVLSSDFEHDRDDLKQKYLGRSQENDAPVLSLEWDSDHCELVLNEYEAWRLSTALSGVDEINRSRQLPLTIQFDELNAICAWMDNEFGELRRLKSGLNYAIAGANEYIRERILQWTDERFVAILTLYPTAGASKRISEEGPAWERCSVWHTPSLYLGVDCRSVSYVEEQAGAIARHFGERGSTCYELLDKNRWLFSQGAFQPFVDLAERGVVPSEKLP